MIVEIARKLVPCGVIIAIEHKGMKGEVVRRIFANGSDFARYMECLIREDMWHEGEKNGNDEES
jgi:hypothetical protein